MSTPSDLLRKANTAQYVINPSVSGMPIKNPAFYMQPPRANATMWMPEPSHARPLRVAQNDAREAEQNPPMQTSYAPPSGYAATQMAPAQPQTAYNQPQTVNNPPQNVIYPQWTQTSYIPPQPKMQPAQYPQDWTVGQYPQQAGGYAAPMAESDEMRVFVKPPSIPSPVIPNREPAIYRQLMQKHDRAMKRGQNAK